MSDARSTEVVVAITTAAIGVLAALGKGLQWLMQHLDSRRESRATKLQGWHDELAKREAAFDERMEARLLSLERDAQTRGEQTMALRMAFELVASALRAIDPYNNALSRAEQILVATFPLAPIVPPDMTAQLGTIDRKDMAATAAARRTGETG